MLLLITFSKPRMQKNIQNNKKSKCVAHLSAIHDFISKPPRQKDVIRECRRSLLEQLSRKEKDVGSLICETRKFNLILFEEMKIHITSHFKYFPFEAKLVASKDPRHSRNFLKLLMFVSLRSSTCATFSGRESRFPGKTRLIFLLQFMFLFNKCFFKIKYLKVTSFFSNSFSLRVSARDSKFQLVEWKIRQIYLTCPSYNLSLHG